MAEYYGIIHDVIKRGYNAYQVTFRIQKICGPEDVRGRDSHKGSDDVLIYRADIAIEKDRSILFPDRELGKCLSMYHESANGAFPGIGWESQRNIGELADTMCRQIRDFLLDRQWNSQARAA